MPLSRWAASTPNDASGYAAFDLTEAEQEARSGPDFSACIDRAGGYDGPVGRCVDQEMSLQEDRLNAAYHRALKRSPSSAARRRLRTGHRAWHAIRHKRCLAELKAKADEGPPGTMEMISLRFCGLAETVAEPPGSSAVASAAGSADAGAAARPRPQVTEPIFSPSRQTSQTGQSSSLVARATAWRSFSANMSLRLTIAPPVLASLFTR